MENASKTLIMAAGILIGLLVLSLAVFLFADFGEKSKGIYSEIEAHQLAEYNAQYTIYSGRKDINIYEIISISNLAKQNNDEYKDYTNFNSEYKVTVKLGVDILQDMSTESKQNLISTYNEVYQQGESAKTGELKKLFKCDGIQYHSNGKVKLISFKEST